LAAFLLAGEVVQHGVAPASWATVVVQCAGTCAFLRSDHDRVQPAQQCATGFSQPQDRIAAQGLHHRID
jgi:hypothetical protein